LLPTDRRSTAPICAGVPAPPPQEGAVLMRNEFSPAPRSAVVLRRCRRPLEAAAAPDAAVGEPGARRPSPRGEPERGAAPWPAAAWGLSPLPAGDSSMLLG
jgi:hypothetical protein